MCLGARGPPSDPDMRSLAYLCGCAYTLYLCGIRTFCENVFAILEMSAHRCNGKIYSSTGCSTTMHLPWVRSSLAFLLFACRCGNQRRNRRNRWQNYVIGALPHPPTPEMMALCHWLHDREHCRALIYAAHASAPKIAGHCGGGCYSGSSSSRAHTHTHSESESSRRGDHRSTPRRVRTHIRDLVQTRRRGQAAAAADQPARRASGAQA